MKTIEEQGYVILAVNSPTVDYIDCARTLAKTLRYWNPAASVCLITDAADANDTVLFNHYRQMAHSEVNPYANDWKAFELSPYRETIKLEADMLICSDIEHWWTMFRHRDVVISTGCRNYYDQVSGSRHYRQFVDANDLPDVYNAITYWRLSKTAQEFFGTVRSIFENWDQYRKLVKFAEDVPSTDFVYAMAAEIVGRERVTMPYATYPKIVHMKQHHIGTQTEQWGQELVWESTGRGLRINTVEQWGAFHYGRGWNHS